MFLGPMRPVRSDAGQKRGPLPSGSDPSGTTSSRHSFVTASLFIWTGTAISHRFAFPNTCQQRSFHLHKTA